MENETDLQSDYCGATWYPEPLPLDLLERRINAWIARVKAGREIKTEWLPGLKRTIPSKPDSGEQHLERVRRICLALPETFEKLSHGEPTFFVHKRVFAMCSNNHHNDGHVAVVIPAAIGIQAMLIEKAPKKFYRPPYVGGAGWVGIELGRVNDKELALHLQEAWRLIAPEKFHSLLE